MRHLRAEEATKYESPKSLDVAQIFIIQNQSLNDLMKTRKTVQKYETGPQFVFPFIVVFDQQKPHWKSSHSLTEFKPSTETRRQMIGGIESGNADDKSLNKNGLQDLKACKLR